MNSSLGTISSGAFANITGSSLERFVEQKLIEKGYIQFKGHKKQILSNRKTIEGKQYATQVPVGTTIYQSPRKCDFFTFNKSLFPEGLIIECKWQQSVGSVDEKYPFLILNIIKTNIPTVILLDGDGYKKLAKEWLKEQVKKEKTLVSVWNMSEFQKEINNKFLG